MELIGKRGCNTKVVRIIFRISTVCSFRKGFDYMREIEG